MLVPYDNVATVEGFSKAMIVTAKFFVLKLAGLLKIVLRMRHVITSTAHTVTLDSLGYYT
jgi:hypothetical protein